MATTHSERSAGDRVTPTTAAADAVARLHRTIASVLGIDASIVSDDLSPDLIDAWDSLNHLNIAMAIEVEFAVAFDADDIMTMRDVRSIRSALQRHGLEI